MAEIVKAGFIADPVILDLIEADPQAAARPHRRGAARVDPARDRGQGRRGRRRREGIGRCARSSTTATPWPTPSNGASATSGATAPRCRSAWCSPPSWAGWPAGSTTPPCGRHRDVLTALGLPVTYDADALPELLEYMAGDKKTRSGMLRFVVLDGLAKPGRLEGPDPALLAAAYAEVMPPVARRRQMTTVLVLNGPNLGRLGQREPEVYGSTTYDDLVAMIEAEAAELGLSAVVRQSDSEAQLMAWLHAAADAGRPGDPQRRCADPHLDRAAGCLRASYGAADRGAHLECACARGLSAPLLPERGGDRSHRRTRSAGLPAGAALPRGARQPPERGRRLLRGCSSSSTPLGLSQWAARAPRWPPSRSAPRGNPAPLLIRPGSAGSARCDRRRGPRRTRRSRYRR